MKSPYQSRRLVAAIGVGLAMLVTGWLFRPWLGGYAIRTILGMTGAAEIKFHTVVATPWKIVVENLEFRHKAHNFTAHRLSLERSHWWMLSLGDVQVEGARVLLTIDGSDINPWSWTTYQDRSESIEPARLPVESLALEGELIIRVATQPDRVLKVRLDGSPKDQSAWIGSLLVNGPGLTVSGGGTLLDWGKALDFQVHRAEMDLESWQGFIRRMVYLPGGPWEMGGKLTGVAEGHVTAKQFAATARVSLREGRMRAGTQDIVASGAETDLEFSDLWKFRTKSGTLRLRELRVGRLPLRNVVADFGLFGEQRIDVTRATFDALGGRVEADSFRYVIGQHDTASTLRVSGIDLRQLLELSTGVGVKLSGRVDGSLPLMIHQNGVRFGTGHLKLTPGGRAELGCEVTSLLRSGAGVTDESLTALKATRTELLQLRLDEMQFDVRPADIPLGCSARVHVAGTTAAGPVVFDFNVNGPIETYLNILPQ